MLGIFHTSSRYPTTTERSQFQSRIRGHSVDEFEEFPWNHRRGGRFKELEASDEYGKETPARSSLFKATWIEPPYRIGISVSANLWTSGAEQSKYSRGVAEIISFAFI